ncbi:hypothetical protein BOX15_Mlig024025g1 [Macrostomum lignano]|uniref:Branchpoint-bridging protein n=1 Tax=Macrostomum lignano TaxID=282301 RepID=A0A267FA94_9PLAT|nr:hypothetical protein BOX15_Mlig024025g3 [Macrostomum lignano]PAA70039.1 hypothetical protein BOX15_Mlig024025g1 [Macrostomum lignano]
MFDNGNQDVSAGGNSTDAAAASAAAAASSDSNGAIERKRARKRRWGGDDQEKIQIPGMPTIVPSNMDPDKEKQYINQIQIEDITRKLRSGDLGIPTDPSRRSPSPEPIYGSDGKRLNTREYRTKRKMEELRHKLIQEVLELNPDYKPPSDYKPPTVKVTEKIYIPQEEHPDVNFVGLIIGPRGNTLKNLERETNCRIIIRGKGSVKEGKIRDGTKMPGEDDDLHAYVTSMSSDSVRNAIEKIRAIIKQGIEQPEENNELRRKQLRELALFNGTLREDEGLAKLRQLAEASDIITNQIVCTNCGGAGHLAKDCRAPRGGGGSDNAGGPGSGGGGPGAQHQQKEMDSEYSALMQELGVSTASSSTAASANSTYTAASVATSSFGAGGSGPGPRRFPAPTPSGGFSASGGGGPPPRNFGPPQGGYGRPSYYGGQPRPPLAIAGPQHHQQQHHQQQHHPGYGAGPGGPRNWHGPPFQPGNRHPPPPPPPPGSSAGPAWRAAPSRPRFPPPRPPSQSWLPPPPGVGGYGGHGMRLPPPPPPPPGY